MYRKIMLLAVCLLAPFLITACSETAVPELLEPAVVESDTAVAEIRELADVYCYEGFVEPQIVQAGFSAGGIIDEVFVGIGSSVKKGDVLAELDTVMARETADSLAAGIEFTSKSNDLANRQTECDIEIAEIELERLIAEGADNQAIRLKEIEIENMKNSYYASLELQQLSLDKNKKQLDEYRRVIENSKLTAPCDGTVIYCTAAAGDWAMAYSAVMWIADDNSSNISCGHISPHEISSAYDIYAVVGGNRVEVEHVPLERAAYIRMMASDTVNSVFTVLDSTVDIENGMYACIMLTKDYVSEALTVPSNAVMQDGTENYVYLVSADGAQTRRSVEIGLKTDAFIQITKGLREGDEVYVGN